MSGMWLTDGGIGLAAIRVFTLGAIIATGLVGFVVLVLA